MEYKEVQKIAKDTIEYAKKNIYAGMSLIEIREMCERKMLELGADSFWYCNRKKRACQDEGKGKRNFIKAVCENVGGSFSARKKRGILGQSKFKEIERNTA